MISPSGMGRPALRYTCTLPSAVALVARSMTTGPAPPGMAIAIGLVPKRASRPPQGTTNAACTRPQKSCATRPCSASRST